MQHTIGDALIALVRTIVPLAVGWLIAFLALPESVAPQVELIATASATAAYYALIRLASAKWQWLEWFLGYPVAPEYSPRSD